jgi:FkbM family methyltransferase
MINKTQGYFDTIIWCIKNGKLFGAVLQGFLPLIILFGVYLDRLKYQVIKFQNRKREQIIVDINNRYKMFLDLNDKGICQELSIYKTREVFSTGFIQEIITEDMTIIDIGANIGYYALLESQLSSKGHVYAIEPVPKNYNLLTKNIALNDCKNISVYNLAIGNSTGFLDMYIYDKCNWSSFTDSIKGNIIDTIPVHTTTLDKFIESNVPDHPHFIRMDVEGYEYEILKGSLATLKTAAPLILCIELHPHLMSQEKVIECITILKRNNFRVKAIFREVETPSSRKYIALLNESQKNLQLPQFGFNGNNFDILEELLIKNHCVMVFFEKIT